MCLYVGTYVLMYVFMYACVCMDGWMSFYLCNIEIIHICVCVCFLRYFCVSLYVSVHLFSYLFLRLCPYVSIYSFIFPSIHLFIFPSIYCICTPNYLLKEKNLQSAPPCKSHKIGESSLPAPPPPSRPSHSRPFRSHAY